jgi:hypothetical protein
MDWRFNARPLPLAVALVVVGCAGAGANLASRPADATAMAASAGRARGDRDHDAWLPAAPPQHTELTRWRELLADTETAKDVVDRYLERIKSACDELHPGWNATIDAATQSVEFAFDIPSEGGGARAFRGGVKLLLDDLSEDRALTIIPQTTAEITLIRDGMIWDVDDNDLRRFSREIQDLLSTVR